MSAPIPVLSIVFNLTRANCRVCGCSTDKLKLVGVYDGPREPCSYTGHVRCPLRRASDSKSPRNLIRAQMPLCGRWSGATRQVQGRCVAQTQRGIAATKGLGNGETAKRRRGDDFAQLAQIFRDSSTEKRGTRIDSPEKAEWFQPISFGFRVFRVFRGCPKRTQR
jgi:hypothetical protein